MYQLFKLSLIFFLFIIGCTNKKEPEKKKISSKEIVKSVKYFLKDWKQEDELWYGINIQLEDPKILIHYRQQVAHPFLAEYNRKIVFSNSKKSTDTITMLVNSGGSTLINIYRLTKPSNKKQILMLQDNFGYYFFDFIKFKYSESDEMSEYEDFSIKTYLGRIDGEKYPLKFLKSSVSREKKIE